MSLLEPVKDYVHVMGYAITAGEAVKFMTKLPKALKELNTKVCIVYAPSEPSKLTNHVGVRIQILAEDSVAAKVQGILDTINF